MGRLEIVTQQGAASHHISSHTTFFFPAQSTNQYIAIKGTVSRDFFALVFSLNLFILVLLEMP